MSKLKKFLKENKVLLFLGIILIVWLIAFVVIVIIFFYGSSDNVYGNRLDPIKDLPITETLEKDIKEIFTKEELVNNVTINVKGKIIYINVNFDDGYKVSDAKGLGESVIPLFSESLLNAYDIEIWITNVINNKENYTICGTRNANSDGKVVWKEYSLTDPNAEEESSAKK